jgi:ABC transport system ATP-binding/permease protein
MAFLLGCENVSLEFATKRVFDGVTLGVETGDRIGIVGRNGDGKSSLLALMAGTLTPDAGRIIRTGTVMVGLLSQRDALCDDDTVIHAVVGETPEYVWASDARIRDILDHLLLGMDRQQTVATLSGGQRRRVDLARVLIGDYDVLLLDEPTNHLDVLGISWLAEHLRHRWPARQGALLVVTHDRWFLDAVCERMWEVHDGTVDLFEGGYSAYIQQRLERDVQAVKAAAKRRNLLRRELAWLSRGAPARSTKPRFRMDAALDLIADEPPLRDTIALKRTAMSRLGKQVVDLIDVSVSFPGKTVLDHADWAIGPGDRYGILGINGVGKTTLLEVIQGHLKTSGGRVRIGKTVRFAVLSQQLAELERHADDRVRELCARYKTTVQVEGKEVTSAQLLERLGFDRAQLNQHVRDLSGGQRRRLQLMLVLLDEPNVLILDEPGNDLDTDMLAQVEALLDTWPGTLLLVTHDRYLMERVTDHQFALIDGKIRHLPDGVDGYLKLLATQGSSALVSRPEVRPSKTSEGISAAEARALKKQRASLERRMQTLRDKVEHEQTRLYGVDPADFVVLGDIQADIDTLAGELSALEDEWLEVSALLDD